jgi:uracil-DNA glycosylase
LLDLNNLLPTSWKRVLDDHSDCLAKIDQQLEKDFLAGKVILPRKEWIFSALELAPENVQVIILGQDPYPRVDHAIGRAFAVPKGEKSLPPTLRNIFKELASDLGVSETDPSLMRWQEQGVLLLNSTLTVNQGESDSHKGYGWNCLTNNIIKVLAMQGAKAILWGKRAEGFARYFNEKAVVSAHPSPLSAYRGFFGSMPFSRINAMLSKPINW